jgi:hypothetical protein
VNELICQKTAGDTSAAGRIDLLAPAHVGPSGLPIYVACIPAAPLKLAHCPRSLAATLPALPSVSLIRQIHCISAAARSARLLPRGFTGHVAHPIRSIRRREPAATENAKVPRASQHASGAAYDERY